MSITATAKNEILTVKLTDKSAQRAFISAFLRTCGGIEVKGDKLGFYVQSDEAAIDYFCKVVNFRYGEKCSKTKAVGGRASATMFCENGVKVLADLGILRIVGGEVEVSLNVGDVADGENAFKAYLSGAFLGSGSMTVPDGDVKKRSKTGYHLEVVFSKYITANDFSDLLAGHGFFPKLVERKDQFVVYFKNVEEILNYIGLCGANGAYLKIAELQITKEIKNVENRKMNCEMSNLTKTIDASIKQREDIKTIEETVGLEGLKPQLYEVAKARIENEDLSLSELAEMLGITKSCLVHRLNKLSQIAKTLQ